jgi:hypothetical protein
VPAIVEHHNLQMLRSQAFLLIIAGALLAGTLRAADETLPPAQVTSGGSTIEVIFAPGKINLPLSKVLAWISSAADSVSAYYGRFPVPRGRIFLRPAVGRRGVFNGTTYGFQGGFTRISLGQLTSQDELDNDWMMTHELLHLAFPDIAGDEHHWIEEGMATYIEPIARAQIGAIRVERVWGDMARYMPQGLPEHGDQGLDHTDSWRSTYWGGALFWLVADVQIREHTNNKKGLQDAMRAVLNAGGSIREEWPIEHVLEVGDKATGGKVLTDLYNQMKAKPVQTDLNDLWRKLGIQVNNNAVTFDDTAPLANIRKAITAPTKTARH